MPANVILLPLEARPVCFQLPISTAEMAGINLHTPPKSFLGVLKQAADLSQINVWLERTLRQYPEAPIIVSLDLLVYGGLIPSRLHTDSLETLQLRLQNFSSHSLMKTRCVYSFSSIMRIPNYNNAEEEPDYWAQEGEAIYHASANAHASGDVLAAFNSVSELARRDFLNRRQINFELNQSVLQLVESGQIKQHLFAQDDTGEFGLNVQEAAKLKEFSKHLPVTVQTGADEVALIMLCRSVLDEAKTSPRIVVEFWPENSAHTIAKFDGLPIQSVVQSKISACGSQLVTNQLDADITLFVNGPRENRMGDHCENLDTGSLTLEQKRTSVHRLLELVKQPLAIADVAFANGGDPELITPLIDAQFSFLDLFAYAGWNTPGNSIGTTVAMALLTWHAKRTGRFNVQAHTQLLLTRFLDDWGYQACVRKQLRASDLPAAEAEANLNQSMRKIETTLEPVLDIAQLRPKSYSLPCQRYFEIEITF